MHLNNPVRYTEALALLDTVVNASIDPSAYFYRALCLTHQGQFERALTAWDEAIKRQPGSLAGSFNKGLTLCLAGYWTAAQAQLERAALLDPAGASHSKFMRADPCRSGLQYFARRMPFVQQRLRARLGKL